MKTHNITKSVDGPSYFPQLKELLHSLVKLSAEFLSLLQAEKKALTGMNIPVLAEITRKKDMDLTRIQRLDENIQEISRRMIPATEKASENIKLADTVPYLNKKDGLILEKYQKKLSLLRTEIVTANYVNKKFTNDTLGYLNDAVSLICNGIVSDPTYNSGSQEKKAKTIPALVSREV